MISTVKHDAPLLFCAPGSKDGLTTAVQNSLGPANPLACYTCGQIFSSPDEIKRHLEREASHIEHSASDGDIDAPAPWPVGKELRVKFFTGEGYIDRIRKIIHKCLEDWLRNISAQLKVTMVSSSDPADIRISFRRNEPNWSCVGSRATRVAQDKPTMNFAFVGWQDRHTIYSHAHIARVAAHLFGHALGLPHAVSSWSSSWNTSELNSRYGSFYADKICSARGCPKIDNPQSIMGYDRPAALGSGRDDYGGGFNIDQQSRQFLKSLYPEPAAVSHYYTKADDQNGLLPRQNKLSVKISYSDKRTANIIAGLALVNMGNTYNFRARARAVDVVPRCGFNIQVETWSGSHLWEAVYNVMSFEDEDTRIQTGQVRYEDLRTTSTSQPGVSVSTRVTFSKPFRKMPKVVVFINALDLDRNKRLRVDMSSSEIDRKGFKLTIGNWGGKYPVPQWRVLD
ncbi:hypothetical protein FOVSG1_010105 [Fusarium oxysporum f. sp. vasinfectum]